jgi:Alpha-L-fucosidase
MENGVDMHIKGGVPRLGRQLKQTAVDRPTRAVDQHIDRAKLSGRFLHAACSIAREAKISLNHHTPSCQRLDAPLRVLGFGIQLSPHDGDIGAFCSQGHRGSAPDTFGAAGDQTNSVLQFHNPTNAGTLARTASYSHQIMTWKLGLARLTATALLVTAWDALCLNTDESLNTSSDLLRLPATDSQYRRVKDYIEDVPEPGYHHASEAARETFRDMKFGVRIHWGVYALWEAGESWPLLNYSNEQRQAYQQLYQRFNPTNFNAAQPLPSNRFVQGRAPL